MSDSLNNKGILFIVSGFAGTGKSTITRGLVEQYDCYELSVSATTRTPREYEVHGREYFFISKEDFEKLIGNDELLEHAQYLDNYYGTPKKWVESRLDAGKDIILEIEMQGALQIKEKHPDSVLIFLLPPSIDELRDRLKKRGSEPPEQIEKRISRAKEEIQYIEKYDYLVINDVIEKTIDIVHNIVQSEKFKADRAGKNVEEYIINFKE